MATLKALPIFRYLDPDQTETVLVKTWGNTPRQEKPQGMLFPAEIGPASPESRGVVITYAEDGCEKIAGKALAKSGLFKLILGAFLKKLLWGRKKEEAATNLME